MLSRRARRVPSPALPRKSVRLPVLMLLGTCAMALAPSRSLALEVVTSSLAGGTAGAAYSDVLQAASGTTPYGWTIELGALPSGITLDLGSGALSGSATLAGTSDFVVRVTDALGDTATRALSMTIAPAAASALIFVTGPSAVLVGAVMTPAVQVRVEDTFGNGVPGESVALALVGSGTLSGGGAVPSGATGIAGFAALSIDRAGSAQLSASAGALGPVSSGAFTVSCPAITVDPATLPNGAQGSAYNGTLTASGGTAPYGYAVTSGALPGGLSLSATGDLTGTPNAGGSFSFTVTATDANECTGSRAYTLIVCEPFSVLPATLPPGQNGVAYSQSLGASGGVPPVSYAITAGALPPGLTLSGAGLLSGTPTATGQFAFTVAATATGGCTGSTAYTLTVPGIPAAVGDLAATPLTSGNDADGTVRIQMTFTPTPFAVTAEVYRAAFGGYPRYDDAGGLVPATPSYPPGPPWVLTAVTASGQSDEPAARDAYSYVVFVKNTFGQVSAVSNKTDPTPNYALGDVSDGFTAGAGDNRVSDLDISLLGAHYGISGSAILSAGVSYLDVGPTVDLALTSRPFTDARLDFEDLIVFATNYGAVSSPATLVAAADTRARAATTGERLSVSAPSRVAAGETFDAVVRMEAGGRVQGLSAELGWEPAIAAPVSVTSTGWVESQLGVLWSPRPGAFDAALLGVRERGLAGAAELVRVTFRASAAGDPGIRIARAIGRDAANRPLAEGVLRYSGPAAVPTRTLLLAPAPNPTRGATSITFALAQAADADLAIFSVDGRRVRTLARGAFAAGTHTFTWEGDDERQRAVAPGIYFAHLVTSGTRFSRTLVHVR